MKFTSAPKKLVLTGLSAAMVVAFAPAVAPELAQAAIANSSKVTVTFDANGGTVAGGNAIQPQEYTVANDAITISNDDVSTLQGNYSKNGATFKGWFYDADGDGVDTAGQQGSKDVAVSGGSLATTGFDAGTSAITLKAEYNEPTVTVTDESATGGKPAQSVESGGKAFKIATANLNTAHSYQLTVAKDGTTIYTSYNDRATSQTGLYDIAYESDSQRLGTGSGKIAVSTYGAGTYTFTLTDTTAGSTAATATYSIYQATADATSAGQFGEGAQASQTKTVLVSASETWGDIKGQVGNPTAKAGQAAFGNEWTVDGAAVTDATKVAGKTITAVYETPQVSAGVLDQDEKTITWTPRYLASDAKPAQSYDVTIAGPSGTIGTFNVTSLDSVVLQYGASNNGQASAGSSTWNTTEGLAEGDYTATVRVNYAAQGTTTPDPVTVSGSVSVVRVTLDANGGTWARNATTSSYYTVGQSYGSLIDATSASGLTAPSGTKFAGWSTDGTKAGLLKESATVSGAATLRAYYEEDSVIAPMVTLEKNSDGTWNVKAATETSGATLKVATKGFGDSASYGTAVTLPSSGYNVDPTSVAGVKVTASKTISGSLKEAETELVSGATGYTAATPAAAASYQYGTELTGVKTTVDTALGTADDPVLVLKQGASKAATATAAAVDSSIKGQYAKAVADAQAKALSDTGYAKSAAWQGIADEAAASVIDAAVDGAVAEVEELKGGLVAQDGSEYVLDASSAKSIESNLSAVKSTVATALSNSQKATTDRNYAKFAPTEAQVANVIVAQLNAAVAASDVTSADVAAADKAIDAYEAALADSTKTDEEVAAAKQAAEDAVAAVKDETAKAELTQAITDAEQEASDAKAAAAVDTAAAALAEVTDENYETVYAAAKDAYGQYSALNDSQKALVKTASVEKIATALSDSAEKYQAAAETAKAAQKTAEDEAADAKAAQTTAESERDAAQSAAAEAQQKQQAAETAQANAEAAQKTAEEAQATAEAARDAAASAQSTAEAKLAAVTKTTTGVKARAAKKKATVSWKKASGYKYQVSYKQPGKKAKTKKTSKAKVTVKGLKSGKRYAFKVRSYKKIDGKNYYGKWSKTVKRTVK